mmetsp:Transcript_6717/g.16504  ORF Transcript_6717/g.16504 Transcript_6717/m.16504 type:complete len:118 (-) Transcript_6717:697-1050(-)
MHKLEKNVLKHLHTMFNSINSSNDEGFLPPLFIPNGFPPTDCITLFDSDNNRPDLSWSLSSDRKKDHRPLFVLSDLFTDSESAGDSDDTVNPRRSYQTLFAPALWLCCLPKRKQTMS